MLYLTNQLLQKDLVDDLRLRLMIESSWQDGIVSTTQQIRTENSIKKNIEISPNNVHKKFSDEIINSLFNNDYIKLATYPAIIHNIIFSRTGPGMYYRPHVDVPFSKEGRRDLSFTIFLNDPEEYKGGELILYNSNDSKSIKLSAGDIVIYPTKYLHEVKAVTEGERIVCVGWIESQIANDDDRESLLLLKLGMTEISNEKNIEKAIQKLNLAYNRIYRRFLN